MPSFCLRKIKSGAAVFSMNSEQHLASWKASLHPAAWAAPEPRGELRFGCCVGQSIIRCRRLAAPAEGNAGFSSSLGSLWLAVTPT